MQIYTKFVQGALMKVASKLCGVFVLVGLLQGCSTASKYGEGMMDAAGRTGGFALPFGAAGMGIMVAADALGGKNAPKVIHVDIKLGEGKEWDDAVARAHEVLKDKKVSVEPFQFNQKGVVKGLPDNGGCTEAAVKQAAVESMRASLIEILQKAGVYDSASPYQIAGAVNVVSVLSDSVLVGGSLSNSRSHETFFEKMQRSRRYTTLLVTDRQKIQGVTCENIVSAIKPISDAMVLNAFGVMAFDKLLDVVANQ